MTNDGKITSSAYDIAYLQGREDERKGAPMPNCNDTSWPVREIPRTDKIRERVFGPQEARR